MGEDIYKAAFKQLILIVATMAVCRFTHGYALFPLALFGMGSAILGGTSWPLMLYALFSVCVVMSNVLLPRMGMAWGFGLRGGILAISLAMIVGARQRSGPFRLPLGALLPFLAASLLSLGKSWVPAISALKLFQFSLFVFGIWLGTQNMQARPNDLFRLRAFFFATAVLFVVGSALSYPFPSVSFAISMRGTIEQLGVDAAVAEFLANMGYMKTLFCGITNHSQALSPLMTVLFAYVACDMLFVERRFRWLHVLLLVLAPPMLYMSRSRVGFFSLAAALGMIYFYTSRKIALEATTKRHLGHGMLLFIFTAIVGAGIAELRDDTISRWLRKTDDVAGDNRSWSEAITSSRQGLMEQSMDEFRRSPVIGSGFQVAWYTKDQYEDAGGGFVLSASIEKGVLPVMVLGETGVIGSFAFLFFLAMFFSECAKRRYYVTITMMTVQLATNMGEATFFSPGGAGGTHWVICAVGGFVLDTIILTRRECGWPRNAIA